MDLGMHADLLHMCAYALRVDADYCIFQATWPHDFFLPKNILNSDCSYLHNTLQEFDKKDTIQLRQVQRRHLALIDCNRVRFYILVFGVYWHFRLQDIWLTTHCRHAIREESHPPNTIGHCTDVRAAE